MSVCLSAIMRDEAPRITSMLESLVGHVDQVVLVDTGSVDDTIKIALEALQQLGLAGEVHEIAWTDFATARTSALELARGRCDYVLVLDADNALEALPGALEGLSADLYAYRLDDGKMRWMAPRLLRDDPSLDWRWEGAVHERLVCSRQVSEADLDGVTVRAHGTGGERTGRWSRDLELLRDMHAKQPGDMHTAFHLANALLSAGNMAAAADLYRTLLSSELNTADPTAAERRYLAMWLLGQAEDDPARQLHWYQTATASRPQRLEAAWSLLRALSQMGEHQRVMDESAKLLGRPISIPDDRMMVMPAVYNWAIVHERSLAAARAGYLDEARNGFEYLLRRSDLPNLVRVQCQENLARVIAKRPQSR